MEYVEGVIFDDLHGVNDTIKCNIFTLLYLYTRDMILVKNFFHGDLHSSNWKVVHCDNELGYKLVLYDFGYCWSVKEEKKVLVELSMNRFEANRIDCKEDIIQNYAELFYHYIEHSHIVDKQGLRNDLSDYIRNSSMVTIYGGGMNMTPTLIYKFVSEFCFNHGFFMTHELIQLVILYTQLYIMCAKYGFSNIDGKNIDRNNVYIDRYVHCLNVCETYDIFPEYREYINKKVSHRVKSYGTSLFSHVNMDEYECLKDLAIN